MLLNVPLPAALLDTADAEQEEKYLLACFPLVGAVVGIVMYTIAWLVMFLFPVSAAAAVVGSITIALITEYISIGGNISTLSSFICARKNKFSGQEMLSAIENESPHRNTIDLIFFLSLYLLKLFCIGLLIYHERTSWFIIVFTMSYLIRSQMATWDDLRTSQPLIEIEDKNASIKAPWFFASFIILIAGISYLPAVIIIIIATYLIIKYLEKIVDNELGGVTGSIIGTAGTAAELFFLLAGIAMLLRK